MNHGPTRKPFFLSALAFAVLLSPAAQAEPIPLPKIDYEARATLMNDGSLLVRHAAGRMRIEMQMPQLKTPAVGFIDLKRKVMVLLLPIPGAGDTAMEVGFVTTRRSGRSWARDSASERTRSRANAARSGK